MNQGFFQVIKIEILEIEQLNSKVIKVVIFAIISLKECHFYFSCLAFLESS